MWATRFAVAVLVVTRSELALAGPCESPSLDPAPEVTVGFAHEADRLTLTFRRDGSWIGTRVLDVHNVDCASMIATAQLVVELTMEELAFAEAERSLPTEERGIVLQELPPTPGEPAASPSPEVLPELLIEAATQVRAVTQSRSLKDAIERPTFRLGTTADVGVGLALSASASVIGSAVLDAAYAPAGSGVVPEVSGRGGLFTSLPARSRLDERDVWLSVLASRWDVCGGVRGPAFRARGCAGTIAGSMLADGAQSSPLVSLGARLEAAWQATDRTALLVAAEAISLQAPSQISVTVEEWADPVTEELSPISLMFSTGVTGDWLTL